MDDFDFDFASLFGNSDEDDERAQIIQLLASKYSEQLEMLALDVAAVIFANRQIFVAIVPVLADLLPALPEPALSFIDAFLQTIAKLQAPILKFEVFWTMAAKEVKNNR